MASNERGEEIRRILCMGGLPAQPFAADGPGEALFGGALQGLAGEPYCLLQALMKLDGNPR